MELRDLEARYTKAPRGMYRWYVGVYNEYLDMHVEAVSAKDKPVIFSIFRKLRDEHTLNWNRNTLYEYREDASEEVRRILLRMIRSTDKFDVLKVCLYVLRNMRKNRVIDDYVLRRVPALGGYIDGYTPPPMGYGLQNKLYSLGRGEQSLRLLETLFITNKGYESISAMRESTFDQDKYHTIDMNSIEILLTEDCNLKCHNCDKLCGKAVSQDRMTVEQVKKFIDESVSFDKKWVRIAVSGGEPTTHPDIIEVVGLLLDYRKKHLPDSSLVQVVSNGYGGSVDVLQEIRRVFKQEIALGPASAGLIVNNEKRNKLVLHSPINRAPADNPAFGGSEYRNGCWVPELSGLGLTRYGYYCCGTASAIDRVFGYDLGVKLLSDVTMHRLVLQRTQLCRLCGRFNDLSEDSGRYSRSWVVEEVVSPTWGKAFESYQSSRPFLTTY